MRTLPTVPFTVSHAIVGAPARKVGLTISAVAIGAMSPDFVFFLPEPLARHLPPGAFEHTLLGVLTLDAALAAIALVLWWALFAAPLRAWSPTTIRTAVPVVPKPTWRPGWRRIVLAYVGIVIGGFSHIVWDSFTHPDRFASDRIPLLYDLALGDLTGAQVAQYISSVLGLLLIAVVLFVAWKRSDHSYPDEPASPNWLWPVIIVVALSGLVVGLWEVRDIIDTQSLLGTINVGAFLFLTGSLSAATAALAVCCGLWWWRVGRETTPTDSSSDD